MAQDFIFAQDVILDPDTGKVVAVVRNREVYRDGARIAVLVGARMYDLNGNLLGQLAAGAGSLPMSFKNLLEGKSTLGPRAVGVAMPRPAALRTFAGGLAERQPSAAIGRPAAFREPSTRPWHYRVLPEIMRPTAVN